MINAALIGWPIIMIIMARMLPWQNALVASLIGGYLLLPEQGGLDLPLLPPFEKDTIPCLVLFFLALIMRPGEANSPGAATYQGSVLKGWMPRSIIGQVLLFMLVGGTLMTAITNSDQIRFEGSGTTIPALRLYDGFSMIVRSVAVIVPILLGRKYLADPRAHRVLLIALVAAGLAYSLLALIEIRLSPQMNRWVYGFFAHNWSMHVRGGGFRPLVFLEHGLWLAIFFAMTIIAAFGLSRVMPQKRALWLLAGLWLFMTLMLSNSLGAAIIVVVLLPVVLLFNVRLQLLTAGIIAAIVLFYPFLRGTGLIPTDQIVAQIAQFNNGRAMSLQFRLNNEDELLERANERPLFGWGPYNRMRVYDETGHSETIVDGAWIVAIGQGGWTRYLAEFGLLSVPILLFALGRRRYDVDQATAILCLVLVGNMIDMLPNSGRSPITWLIVGALLGRLEKGRATATDADIARPATPERKGLVLARNQVSQYTRQRTRHDRKRTGLKP